MSRHGSDHPPERRNVMNIDATREGLSRASLVTALTCALVGAGALTTFGPGVPTASAV